MFGQFRQAVRELGFVPTPDDKYCLVRFSEFFKHSVSLGRDGPEKIQMHLSLSIRDRFYDPPAYVVALTAFLHQDRAEVMFYEPKAWRKAEELSAISAFQKSGLAFFESFSSTDILIEWLGRELREGANPQPSKSKSFLEQILFRRRPPKPPRRPPINHYLLSLLYDDAGDHSRACEHCKEWLAFLGDRGANAAHREHAVAQMRQMGCPLDRSQTREAPF